MEARSDFVETLTVTPLRGDCGILTARLVEFSEDGMKVQLSSTLETGRLMRLEFGNDLLMTEVSGCEPHEDEFAASLQVLS